MAYDEELAERVRALLADQPGLSEKRMFGGLSFLLGGRMSVAVSGRGGLMVRVPPERTAAYLEQPHTEAMIMGGRETRGWLRVSAEGIATDAQLRAWVERGRDHALSLPEK